MTEHKNARIITELHSVKNNKKKSNTMGGTFNVTTDKEINLSTVVMYNGTVVSGELPY